MARVALATEGARTSGDMILITKDKRVPDSHEKGQLYGKCCSLKFVAINWGKLPLYVYIILAFAGVGKPKFSVLLSLNALS